MNTLFKRSFSIIMVVSLFTSCSEMARKVDEKRNELSKKAERLDSLVNKVIDLEPLIILEEVKGKNLDSLVNKSTKKTDSIPD